MLTNSKETVLRQLPTPTQAAKVPAANMGQEEDAEAAEEESLPPVVRSLEAELIDTHRLKANAEYEYDIKVILDTGATEYNYISSKLVYNTNLVTHLYLHQLK